MNIIIIFVECTIHMIIPTILHISQEEAHFLLCILRHQRMLSELSMILHCNRSCSGRIYKQIKHRTSQSRQYSYKYMTLHCMQSEVWPMVAIGWRYEMYGTWTCSLTLSVCLQAGCNKLNHLLHSCGYKTHKIKTVVPVSQLEGNSACCITTRIGMKLLWK